MEEVRRSYSCSDEHTERSYTWKVRLMCVFKSHKDDWGEVKCRIKESIVATFCVLKVSIILLSDLNFKSWQYLNPWYGAVRWQYENPPSPLLVRELFLSYTDLPLPPPPTLQLTPWCCDRINLCKADAREHHFTY